MASASSFSSSSSSLGGISRWALPLLAGAGAAAMVACGVRARRERRRRLPPPSATAPAPGLTSTAAAEASRYLLLSIATKDMGALMEEWGKHKIAADKWLKDHPGRVPPVTDHSPEFWRPGGFLAVIDWTNQRVMGAIHQPMPLMTLVEEEEKRIRVLNWGNAALDMVEGKGIVPGKSITHPWFNHVHTVVPLHRRGEPERYLITSSGTDMVVEIDGTGKLLWSWRAWEHGYNKTGEASIVMTPADFDEKRDWRKVASVKWRKVSHPNSALPLPDGNILVTLPLQGVVGVINRRTGDVREIIKDLGFPHSLRRTLDGGFSVCNTLKKEIVFLSAALERLPYTLPIPCGSFLQDCRQQPDGTYMVVNNGNFGNNDPNLAEEAVLQYGGDGSLKKALHFGGHKYKYRLYQTEVLSASAAHHWAEAWRGNGCELEFAWNDAAPQCHTIGEEEETE